MSDELASLITVYFFLITHISHLIIQITLIFKSLKLRFLPAKARIITLILETKD